VNFSVDTEWWAMNGLAGAIQAAGKKPIWPIGGPGFIKAWPTWPVGNTAYNGKSTKRKTNT